MSHAWRNFVIEFVGALGRNRGLCKNTASTQTPSAKIALGANALNTKHRTWHILAHLILFGTEKQALSAFNASTVQVALVHKKWCLGNESIRVLSLLILAVHSLIHLFFIYLLSIGNTDVKDGLRPRGRRFAAATQGHAAGTIPLEPDGFGNLEPIRLEKGVPVY